MLTEPVKCKNCGAVSVNGGSLVCIGCFKEKNKEIEQLRKALCQIWDCKYEADKILIIIERVVGTPIKDFFNKYKDTMYKH